MMVNHWLIMTGWWLLLTPLNNISEFVSWDDDIPNMMGKIKFMFQTTNQVIICYEYGYK